MNLFLETRHLTQAREDHLTCFVAAALETDSSFRAAYEALVLSGLARIGLTPSIKAVSVQARFADHRARPDMLLSLHDGRRVVCEHKVDALETELATKDGGVSLQLERYLGLPDIDAVAYFRSAIRPPDAAVLAHPKYLRPIISPHFLWRDLYEPLTSGREVVASWLREGFEHLGFTPPLPHVGELWPSKSEQVKANQRNFGKLWHSTRSHLSRRWKIGSGSRCELYLTPKTPSLVAMIYVSPLAQGGSLLRVRAHTNEQYQPEVRHRFELTGATLPVLPDVEAGRLANGTLFVDQLASLRRVVGTDADPEKQEARLFSQVVPAVEALELECAIDSRAVVVCRDAKSQ
jgi:hypothetical protein